MQWTNLRPLQVDAIRYLLQTEGDAILSAATASGKTEAAFLPILSKIAAQPRDSVRVIYVGPLKALINDQFGRIEELCNHLDVPVHRWHGDVPASKKAKLVQNPGGVLLITPESLESLFINRSSALRSLFGGLEFVVVDELHSFLDNERGLHLRSLLSRLNGVAVLPFRRMVSRPPSVTRA
jgi:ATP-dependent Lhr-like helicase